LIEISQPSNIRRSLIATVPSYLSSTNVIPLSNRVPKQGLKIADVDAIRPEVDALLGLRCGLSSQLSYTPLFVCIRKRVKRSFVYSFEGKCSFTGGIVEDELISSNIEIKSSIHLPHYLLQLILSALPEALQSPCVLEIDAALIDVVVIQQSLACLDDDLLVAYICSRKGSSPQGILSGNSPDSWQEALEGEAYIWVLLGVIEIFGLKLPRAFEGVALQADED
jgi:hypothetical protein